MACLPRRDEPSIRLALFGYLWLCNRGVSREPLVQPERVNRKQTETISLSSLSSRKMRHYVNEPMNELRTKLAINKPREHPSFNPCLCNRLCRTRQDKGLNHISKVAFAVI